MSGGQHPAGLPVGDHGQPQLLGCPAGRVLGPRQPRHPAPPSGTGSGPAVSGPAVSGPGVSGPAVSGPAVSGPAVSGPAVSGPAVSGRSASACPEMAPGD